MFAYNEGTLENTKFVVECQMFRFVTFTILLVCYSAQILAADNVDYTTQIKPILKLKCYSCHGTLKQQANLRLDTGISLITGGDSGTTVNVDDPSASLLIEVITGEAGFLMPPEDAGAALSEEEIKLVSDWIAQGAKVPKTEEPQADPKTWWSYQPVTSPKLPSTDSAWARNPIPDDTRRCGNRCMEFPPVSMTIEH